MHKFLNKPIIKNTTITYKKVLVAILPTVIVLLILYPDRFNDNISKMVIVFLITIVAAAVISALIQKLSKYIINRSKK